MPEGEIIRLKTFLSERDKSCCEAVGRLLERESAQGFFFGENRRERARRRQLTKRFGMDAVSREDTEEIMSLLLAEIAKKNTTGEYNSREYSSVRGAYIMLAGLISEMVHRDGEG